ncbi:MAG TPA: type IX secretion system membrane protein PorP/SprF [Cyclobacteriaceae bacterium]|nr:type IX secretion system membrane protein PorP/SprF [Cyclobacteriaceae bacterium]HMV10761.1 type IX secretion system membrane protein PorP/SprF [Cyclobacteriaceae bacterium]HMV91277.1 type IX secretion system membrane protein PorP/SprF [Cyclobacteriaceae bacterium]HMX01657.1 type IX secretion system membrane protein PorP/SprF [Cyclobacteriaceae bacterium]HMY91539.1 type IX secretion system membrane protein PorP/SprF [Cyclobacteriaceae bacterium]
MRRFYQTLCILLLALSAVAPAHGQIDPLYAQYLNNPLVINPAYTGLNKELNASVSFRKQWAGFDGSPTTFNATVHTSLFDNKMGAGLILVSDQIGEYKNTMAIGTYSYKIQMDRTFISFGLQAGVVNYKGDNNDLNILDENDPYFRKNMNITKPLFGAGIILTNDNLFLGLSVPRMLKTKGTYQGTSGSVEGDVYTQHFYGMASYIIFINERLRLKPATLLKYVQGNPLSVDVNAVLNIDERYGVGAFTRNFNTYGFLAQAKFGQSFRFAYAFELPTGSSVGSNFTSHEVTLGLNVAVFDFHDIQRVNSF